MIYDAQGIERCRQCAEATHKLLTEERKAIETRILELSGETVKLESYINVLELQNCRPPLRQVNLPVQLHSMRERLAAALKAQLNLVKHLMQYYTSLQMEMVSSGVLAKGTWQYADDNEQHQAILQMLQ